jgi:uncharacterized protein (UPF0332 family)
MNMRGRDFLDVARELVAGADEAHWRSACGRAYYALFLEARSVLERWGITLPRRDQIHAVVRLRFIYAADPDLKQVGFALERLGDLRNHADYKLSPSPFFNSSVRAQRSIDDADVNLVRLDQVDADLTRRATAIADIRAKFP